MKNLMKIITGSIAVILLISMAITSCESLENASNVPSIKFKEYTSFITSDTLGNLINAGELVFSFIDGDADLGEYSAADRNNIVLLPFEKIDGEYFSVDSALYGQSFTFTKDEKLDREGQYKTIQGEIKVELSFYIKPPFDTMRYDFYILDRADHKSNVESTTDITFLDL